MEIILEEPYKSQWRKGYLVVNKDGRKYVNLYNSEKDRTVTSYGRYLVSVQHGFVLPPEIEVDHIDGDHTNDDLSNLRPVTKQMHRLKSVLCGDVPVGEEIRLQCPVCKNWFVRAVRYVRSKEREGVSSLYCSKRCSTSLTTCPLTLQDIETIRALKKENHSSYEISRRTGFSRNTVMKYWTDSK